MITVQDIKKIYGMPIKRKFVAEIDKYIKQSVVQKYINKALKYELTEKDRDWLYEHGKHPGKTGSTYPYLNYLCTIYIHPLTHAQNVFRLKDKFDKIK